MGWLILIKGLGLLFLSPDILTQSYAQMHYRENFNVYLVPSFIIGIYLTYAGFAARPRG